VALFGSVGIAAHSALAFSILYGLSLAVIGLCALPFIHRKPANEAPCEQQIDSRHDTTMIAAASQTAATSNEL
jgi:hypothetical protein